MRIVYIGSLSGGDCGGVAFVRNVPFEVPDGIGERVLVQQPDSYLRVVDGASAPTKTGIPQPPFLRRVIAKHGGKTLK